jgi:hypothetical protein
LWTLQLNTNQFSTPACNESTCRGWQQFIVQRDQTLTLFMQYWLYGYISGNGCPPPGDAGVDGGVQWHVGANGCFADSPYPAVIPILPFINDGGVLVGPDAGSLRYVNLQDFLSQMTLITTAEPGGPDTVMITTDSWAIGSGNDSILSLSQGWTSAEFNIFGYGMGSVAQFNQGTSIAVQLTLTDGSSAAPTCVSNSYTTESNNLTVDGPCCTSASPPTIAFWESNPTIQTTGCPVALNECGGVEALAGTPGQPCEGTCASWTCSGKNSVTCKSAPANACGGCLPLTAHPGESCGQACAVWTCSGRDSLACKSFKNVCGGCSSVPIGPREGNQPGEPCACANGTTSRYYCNVSGQLACDCRR